MKRCLHSFRPRYPYCLFRVHAWIITFLREAYHRGKLDSMIAVIGEMAVSFRRDGNGWKRSYTGLGYSWAVSLKEKGESVVLFSVLPAGRTGKEMAEELVDHEMSASASDPS